MLTFIILSTMYAYVFTLKVSHTSYPGVQIASAIWGRYNMYTCTMYTMYMYTM